MITVKDIREKEFTKQKMGYNEDEVDDFLDEIADQLEILIRENRSLSQKVDELRDVAREAREELAASSMRKAEETPAVQEPAPKPEPQSRQDMLVDEPTYFRNLETTLRETLISAQRIADDTVSDARKKAKQIVSSAEEQSDAMLSASKSEAEIAKRESEEMHKATEEYKKQFMALLRDQLLLLKEEEESLFA